MMGVAKFLVDKEASLRIDFEEPRESFLIKGKFTNPENIEGKKGMLALTMEYDEAHIPTGYKIRINEYLTAFRIESRIPSGAKPNG